MTNEEQRIIIANLCGWVDVNKVDYLRGISPQFAEMKAMDGSNIIPPIWEIPDYCDDLNAIRSAEMHLVDVDQVPDWVAYLVDIVAPRPGWGCLGRIQASEACLRATAAQRCEALLRTLNLWKS